MNIRGVLAALLILLPGSVTAADWEPLSGIYAVTAENYLDPSPSEPKNSHFRIQLTGNSARDLYLAIPGDAVVDDCTGGLSKTAGEPQCVYIEEGSRYDCAFSIDLVEHKVEYGVAC